MTLAEWCEKHGKVARPFVKEGYDPAIVTVTWLADINDPGNREIFRLSDYAVTASQAGTWWLYPRDRQPASRPLQDRP